METTCNPWMGTGHSHRLGTIPSQPFGNVQQWCQGKMLCLNSWLHLISNLGCISCLCEKNKCLFNSRILVWVQSPWPLLLKWKFHYWSLDFSSYFLEPVVWPMQLLKFITQQLFATPTPVSTMWELPDLLVRVTYAHDFVVYSSIWPYKWLFLRFVEKFEVTNTFHG